MTSTSLAFFQQFDSSVAAGTYDSSTSTYSTLTSAVKSFADGFTLIVANYTPSDGELSEQYSKSDGSQTSAVDLTWSYASALTAFAAEAGTSYGSWGAANLSTSSCPSTSGVSVTFEVEYDTEYGGEGMLCVLDTVLQLTIHCDQRICTSPGPFQNWRTGRPTTP